MSEKTQLVLGYLSVTGEIICLTLGAACAQLLSGVIPIFELSSIRYGPQFILTSVVMPMKGAPVLIERRHLVWIVVLSAASTTGTVAYFTAAIYLPLGVLASLEMAGVIIFVTVISKCFIGEAIGCYKIFFIIISLAGLCLLVYEATDKAISSVREETKDNRSDIKDNNTNEAADILNVTDTFVGYLCILLASLALAVFRIVSGNCLKEVDNMSQSLWSSLFGVVCSLILMVALEHPVLPEVTPDWLYLVIHSLSASLLNMLSIVSVSMINPLIVSLMMPLHLVLMFVLQKTWLKDVIPGEGSPTETAGIVLVLVAGLSLPIRDLYLNYRPIKDDEELEELQALQDAQ